jgi:hypothetical protein
MRPTSLIQRFAETPDVANPAIHICSPLSSATNGAALRVGGSVVRAIPKGVDIAWLAKPRRFGILLASVGTKTNTRKEEVP